MNLIDSFLFDTSMAEEGSATTISRIILERVLNRSLPNIKVTPQKTIPGIDTPFHGVRFDAHVIEPTDANMDPEITVYDIEMEKRDADRKSLPKRQRFYRGISDTKTLPTNTDYNKLPEYLSITICNYDPFLLGDMFYSAQTKLTTHPDYDYNDGSINIFLYADGNINVFPEGYGKQLKDLLKFIVSGEKPDAHDDDIEMIANIILDIKQRPEVTTEYMRQWEREQSLKREAAKDNALAVIKSYRKHGFSDEEIVGILKTDFSVDPAIIPELFKIVDDELTPVQ